MNPDRRDELIQVYRDGLLQDVLPFWLEHGIDRQHGGIITALDRDGAWIDTDKSVWQQGRFSWLLGELYNNVEPRDEWLQLLRSGLDFISQHCVDPADGRLWFHVTREGKPIRKRRYALGETFAATAFGEYAQATGDDAAADRARQLFANFVEHHTIPGRMAPKCTDVRPLKSIGFPMLVIVTAQELRDSIDLPEANQWIDRSIAEIERDFLKPELACVMENVGPRGQTYDHFDGRILNPGHAIEAAWFIMHEGKLRSDRRLIETGCQMLDWMWQRGWDAEYGGILYFRDVDHKPVQEYWQDMKFWWPQNEAVIATLLAHQLTGEEKYARWHTLIHDWTQAHFPDPEHGEWFGYLHRDGRISTPLKGNLWKGPFHIPRMQYYCWQRLLEMQAAEKCA